MNTSDTQRFSIGASTTTASPEFQASGTQQYGVESPVDTLNRIVTIPFGNYATDGSGTAEVGSMYQYATTHGVKIPSAFTQGMVNFSTYEPAESAELYNYFAPRDMNTLDSDETGTATVLYGEDKGISLSPTSVQALNVFGRLIPRNKLLESEEGRELIKIAENRRRGYRRNFWGALSDVSKADLPFIGVFAEVAGSWKKAAAVSETFKKLQNYEPVTEEEAIQACLYLQEQQERSEGTFWSHVGDLVRTAPGFAVEIATTGLGMGALRTIAAKGAARPGAKSLAIRLATSANVRTLTRELFDKEIVSAAAKAGASLTDDLVKEAAKKASPTIAKNVVTFMRANPETKALYRGFSDDMLRNIAEHRVAVEQARAIARHTGSAMHKWRETIGQWTTDSFSRAAFDFGHWGTSSSTVLFSDHTSVRRAWADTIAALTIEPVVRGALLFPVAQAPRLLAKPLTGAKDGAVTDSRLSFEASALFKGDRKMMENAKWLAMGTDMLEYMSENAGRSFSAGARAIGLSLEKAKIAKHLVSPVRQLDVATGLFDPNDGIAVGSAMRRIVASWFGSPEDYAKRVQESGEIASIIARRLGVNEADDVAMASVRQALKVRSAAGLSPQLQEVVGKDFTKFVNNAVDDAFKQGFKSETFKAYRNFVAADWMTRHNLTPTEVYDWFERHGYDGILGEMFEERYSGVAQALLGLSTDPNNNPFSDRGSRAALWDEIKQAVFIDGRQFLTEAVGFGIPGGLRAMTMRLQQSVGGGGKLMEVKRVLSNLSDATRHTAVSMPLGRYLVDQELLIKQYRGELDKLEEQKKQASLGRDATTNEPTADEALIDRDIKRVTHIMDELTRRHKTYVSSLTPEQQEAVATANSNPSVLSSFRPSFEKKTPNSATMISETANDIYNQLIAIGIETDRTLGDDFSSKITPTLTDSQANTTLTAQDSLVGYAPELARRLYESHALLEGEKPSWFRWAAHKIIGLAGLITTGEMASVSSDPVRWVAQDFGLPTDIMGSLRQGFRRTFEELRDANFVPESGTSLTRQELFERAEQAFAPVAQSIMKTYLSTHQLISISDQQLRDLAIAHYAATTPDTDDRKYLYTSVNGAAQFYKLNPDGQGIDEESVLSADALYNQHKEEIDAIQNDITYAVVDLMTRGSNHSHDARYRVLNALSMDAKSDLRAAAIYDAAMHMIGQTGTVNRIRVDSNTPIEDVLKAESIAKVDTSVVSYIASQSDIEHVDPRAFETMAYALRKGFDGTEAGLAERNRELFTIARIAGDLTTNSGLVFTKRVEDFDSIEARVTSSCVANFKSARTTSGGYEVDLGSNQTIEAATEEELVQKMRELGYEPFKGDIVLGMAKFVDTTDMLHALRNTNGGYEYLAEMTRLTEEHRDRVRGTPNPDYVARNVHPALRVDLNNQPLYKDEDQVKRQLMLELAKAAAGQHAERTSQEYRDYLQVWGDNGYMAIGEKILRKHGVFTNTLDIGTGVGRSYVNRTYSFSPSVTPYGNNRDFYVPVDPLLHPDMKSALLDAVVLRSYANNTDLLREHLAGPISDFINQLREVVQRHIDDENNKKEKRDEGLLFDLRSFMETVLQPIDETVEREDGQTEVRQGVGLTPESYTRLVSAFCLNGDKTDTKNTYRRAIGTIGDEARSLPAYPGFVNVADLALGGSGFYTSRITEPESYDDLRGLTRLLWTATGDPRATVEAMRGSLMGIMGAQNFVSQCITAMKDMINNLKSSEGDTTSVKQAETELDKKKEELTKLAEVVDRQLAELKALTDANETNKTSKVSEAEAKQAAQTNRQYDYLSYGIIRLLSNVQKILKGSVDAIKEGKKPPSVDTLLPKTIRSAVLTWQKAKVKPELSDDQVTTIAGILKNLGKLNKEIVDASKVEDTQPEVREQTSEGQSTPTATATATETAVSPESELAAQKRKPSSSSSSESQDAEAFAKLNAVAGGQSGAVVGEAGEEVRASTLGGDVKDAQANVDKQVAQNQGVKPPVKPPVEPLVKSPNQPGAVEEDVDDFTSAAEELNDFIDGTPREKSPVSGEDFINLSTTASTAGNDLQKVIDDPEVLSEQSSNFGLNNPEKVSQLSAGQIRIITNLIARLSIACPLQAVRDGVSNDSISDEALTTTMQILFRDNLSANEIESVLAAFREINYKRVRSGKSWEDIFDSRTFAADESATEDMDEADTEDTKFEAITLDEYQSPFITDFLAIAERLIPEVGHSNLQGVTRLLRDEAKEFTNRFQESDSKLCDFVKYTLNPYLDPRVEKANDASALLVDRVSRLNNNDLRRFIGQALSADESNERQPKSRRLAFLLSYMATMKPNNRILFATQLGSSVSMAPFHVSEDGHMTKMGSRTASNVTTHQVALAFPQLRTQSQADRNEMADAFRDAIEKALTRDESSGPRFRTLPKNQKKKQAEILKVIAHNARIIADAHAKIFGRETPLYSVLTSDLTISGLASYNAKVLDKIAEYLCPDTTHGSKVFVDLATCIQEVLDQAANTKSDRITRETMDQIIMTALSTGHQSRASLRQSTRLAKNTSSLMVMFNAFATAIPRTMATAEIDATRDKSGSAVILAPPNVSPMIRRWVSTNETTMYKKSGDGGVEIPSFLGLCEKFFGSLYKDGKIPQDVLAECRQNMTWPNLARTPICAKNLSASLNPVEVRDACELSYNKGKEPTYLVPMFAGDHRNKTFVNVPMEIKLNENGVSDMAATYEQTSLAFSRSTGMSLLGKETKRSTLSSGEFRSFSMYGARAIDQETYMQRLLDRASDTGSYVFNLEPGKKALNSRIEKDQQKFNQFGGITKFIGFGSASSLAHRYIETTFSNIANTGKYTSDDIVGISAGRGATSDYIKSKDALSDYHYQIQKAAEAGATIITDSEVDRTTQKDGAGEQKLAEDLTTKFNYKELPASAVGGKGETGSGVWVPATPIQRGSVRVFVHHSYGFDSKDYSFKGEGDFKAKPNEAFHGSTFMAGYGAQIAQMVAKDPESPLLKLHVTSTEGEDLFFIKSLVTAESSTSGEYLDGTAQKTIFEFLNSHIPDDLSTVIFTDADSYKIGAGSTKLFSIRVKLTPKAATIAKDLGLIESKAKSPVLTDSLLSLIPKLARIKVMANRKDGNYSEDMDETELVNAFANGVNRIDVLNDLVSSVEVIDKERAPVSGGVFSEAVDQILPGCEIAVIKHMGAPSIAVSYLENGAIGSHVANVSHSAATPKRPKATPRNHIPDSLALTKTLAELGKISPDSKLFKQLTGLIGDWGQFVLSVYSDERLINAVYRSSEEIANLRNKNDVHKGSQIIRQELARQLWAKIRGELGIPMVGHDLALQSNGACIDDNGKLFMFTESPMHRDMMRGAEVFDKSEFDFYNTEYRFALANVNRTDPGFRYGWFLDQEAFKAEFAPPVQDIADGVRNTWDTLIDKYCESHGVSNLTEGQKYAVVIGGVFTRLRDMATDVVNATDEKARESAQRLFLRYKTKIAKCFRNHHGQLISSLGSKYVLDFWFADLFRLGTDANNGEFDYSAVYCEEEDKVHDETGTKRIFLAGTLMGFPRTPSGNGSMWAQVVRAGLPITEDKIDTKLPDGQTKTTYQPSRHGLFCSDPRTNAILGCDFDGDKARSYLLSQNGMGLIDDVVPEIDWSEANKSDDRSAYIKNIAFSTRSSASGERHKFLDASVQDPITGETRLATTEDIASGLPLFYTISTRARRAASNVFVRSLYELAYNLPTDIVVESVNFGSDSFKIEPRSPREEGTPRPSFLSTRGLVSSPTTPFPVSSENCVEQVRRGMSPSILTDKKGLENVPAASAAEASARDAGQSRGIAVSTARHFHVAWISGIARFMTFDDNQDGRLDSTSSDKQKLAAAKWLRGIYHFDGISNATFDDIKEMLCSRLGWTPETFDALISCLLDQHGLVYTELDWANRLAKFTRDIKYRAPSSESGESKPLAVKQKESRPLYWGSVAARKWNYSDENGFDFADVASLLGVDKPSKDGLFRHETKELVDVASPDKLGEDFLPLADGNDKVYNEIIKSLGNQIDSLDADKILTDKKLRKILTQLILRSAVGGAVRSLDSASLAKTYKGSDNNNNNNNVLTQVLINFIQPLITRSRGKNFFVGMLAGATQQVVSNIAEKDLSTGSAITEFILGSEAFHDATSELSRFITRSFQWSQIKDFSASINYLVADPCDVNAESLRQRLDGATWNQSDPRFSELIHKMQATTLQVLNLPHDLTTYSRLASGAKSDDAKVDAAVRAISGKEYEAFIGTENADIGTASVLSALQSPMLPPTKRLAAEANAQQLPYVIGGWHVFPNVYNRIQSRAGFTPANGGTSTGDFRKSAYACALNLINNTAETFGRQFKGALAPSSTKGEENRSAFRQEFNKANAVLGFRLAVESWFNVFYQLATTSDYYTGNGKKSSASDASSASDDSWARGGSREGCLAVSAIRAPSDTAFSTGITERDEIGRKRYYSLYGPLGSELSRIMPVLRPSGEALTDVRNSFESIINGKAFGKGAQRKVTTQRDFDVASAKSFNLNPFNIAGYLYELLGKDGINNLLGKEQTEDYAEKLFKQFKADTREDDSHHQYAIDFINELYAAVTVKRTDYSNAESFEDVLEQFNQLEMADDDGTTARIKSAYFAVSALYKRERDEKTGKDKYKFSTVTPQELFGLYLPMHAVGTTRTLGGQSNSLDSLIDIMPRDYLAELTAYDARLHHQAPNFMRLIYGTYHGLWTLNPNMNEDDIEPAANLLKKLNDRNIDNKKRLSQSPDEQKVNKLTPQELEQVLKNFRSNWSSLYDSNTSVKPVNPDYRYTANIFDPSFSGVIGSQEAEDSDDTTVVPYSDRGVALVEKVNPELHNTALIASSLFGSWAKINYTGGNSFTITGKLRGAAGEGKQVSIVVTSDVDPSVFTDTEENIENLANSYNYAMSLCAAINVEYRVGDETRKMTAADFMRLDLDTRKAFIRKYSIGGLALNKPVWSVPGRGVATIAGVIALPKGSEGSSAIFHEYFHTMWTIFRQLRLFSNADMKHLQDAFGVDPRDPSNINEEKAAEAFRKWILAQQAKKEEASKTPSGVRDIFRKIRSYAQELWKLLTAPFKSYEGNHEQLFNMMVHGIAHYTEDLFNSAKTNSNVRAKILQDKQDQIKRVIARQTAIINNTKSAASDPELSNQLNEMKAQLERLQTASDTVALSDADVTSYILSIFSSIKPKGSLDKAKDLAELESDAVSRVAKIQLAPFSLDQTTVDALKDAWGKADSGLKKRYDDAISSLRDTLTRDKTSVDDYKKDLSTALSIQASIEAGVPINMDTGSDDASFTVGDKILNSAFANGSRTQAENLAQNAREFVDSQNQEIIRDATDDIQLITRLVDINLRSGLETNTKQMRKVLKFMPGTSQSTGANSASEQDHRKLVILQGIREALQLYHPNKVFPEQKIITSWAYNAALAMSGKYDTLFNGSSEDLAYRRNGTTVPTGKTREDARRNVTAYSVAAWALSGNSAAPGMVVQQALQMIDNAEESLRQNRRLGRYEKNELKLHREAMETLRSIVATPEELYSAKFNFEYLKQIDDTIAKLEAGTIAPDNPTGKILPVSADRKSDDDLTKKHYSSFSQCHELPEIQESLKACLSAAFQFAAMSKYFGSSGIVPANANDIALFAKMQRNRGAEAIPDPTTPAESAQNLNIGAGTLLTVDQLYPLNTQSYFIGSNVDAWVSALIPKTFGRADIGQMLAESNTEYSGIKSKVQRTQCFFERLFGLDVEADGEILKLEEHTSQFQWDDAGIVYHQHGDKGFYKFDGYSGINGARANMSMAKEDLRITDYYWKMLLAHAKRQSKVVTGINGLRFNLRMESEDVNFYSREAIAERRKNNIRLDDLSLTLNRMDDLIPKQILDEPGGGFRRKFVEAAVGALAMAKNSLANGTSESDVTSFVIHQLALQGLVVGRQGPTPQTIYLTHKNPKKKIRVIGSYEAAVTIPCDLINTCYLNSDTYKRLTDPEKGGRPAELLDRDYVANAFMGVYRDCVDFVNKHPWLTHGDGKYLHNVGTGLPFFGGSGVFMYGVNRAERDAQADAAADVDETAKSIQDLFESSPGIEELTVSDLQHNVPYNTVAGLIETLQRKYNTPEHDENLVAAIVQGKYRAGQDNVVTTGLELNPDSKVIDIAHAILRRCRQDLWYAQTFDKTRRPEKRRANDKAIVAALEKALNTRSELFGGHIGMTDDVIYQITGALPANYQIGHAVTKVVDGLTNAMMHRATLVNFLMTPSMDGAPVYYADPSDIAASTSGLPDAFWTQLANWWAKFNDLESLVRPERSGVENARAVFAALAAQATENKGRLVVEKSDIGSVRPDKKAKYSFVGGGDWDIASISRWLVRDDDNTDSDDETLLNKTVGGAAKGYLKHFLKATRSLGMGGAEQRCIYDHCLSWSKTMSVSFSGFFAFATKWESSIGAVGLAATLASNRKMIGDMIRKNPEITKKLAKLTRGKWWITSDFLGWTDIIDMMDSNDPFLADLYALANSLGVSCTVNLINPIEEATAITERDIATLTACVGQHFGAREAARVRRTMNALFKRGGERAFTYALNGTKLAVIAQLAQKMRIEANANGKAFDPLRDLRPYANYINSEVGGIDPMRYAWATPGFQRWVNRLMFAWQWTVSAWEAGGGKIIEDIFLGGHTSTRQERAFMVGRWLRMTGYVMWGLPQLAQILSYFAAHILDDVVDAFSGDGDELLTDEEFLAKHGRSRTGAEQRRHRYVVAGLSSEDFYARFGRTRNIDELAALVDRRKEGTKDVMWLWQNESKAQWDADITPLLRSISRFDDALLGGAVRNFKEKAGPYTTALGASALALYNLYKGGRLPSTLLTAAIGGTLGHFAPRLVPLYTGTDPSNDTGLQRVYIRSGKQGHEVIRYWTDFSGQMMSKMAMPVQRAIEGVLGYSPTFTAREFGWADMGQFERWFNPDPRANASINLLNAWLPFSVLGLQRNGDAGFISAYFPVSHGVSRFAAKKQIVEELKESLKEENSSFDINRFTDTNNRYRNYGRVSHLLRDVARNGHNPRLVLTEALNEIRDELYEEFFKELPRDINSKFNSKKLNRIARDIIRIDGRMDPLVKSIKKQADKYEKRYGEDDQLRRRWADISGAVIADPGTVRTFESLPSGAELRQAADGGVALKSLIANDKVPKTIFGIPVASTPESYTEQDITFFAEHPDAAGYYEL